MTTFQFLSNEAGEEEGLNHSGIETFRGSLFESLARECGQNSLDAKLIAPVRLNIQLREARWGSLPGHRALADAIRSCARAVAARSGKKRESEFFSRASAIIESETVSVLEISDENTRGLEGPAEPGKPFHSLVKADGVSSKMDGGAGGSFGIGKYASYAVSGLRTVFYSTCYLGESGQQHFLAQGKVLLMSHARDGAVFRRTGYWGAGNYQPVTRPEEVPEWLRRSAVGTSVFIVGFVSEPEWQLRMLAAVVQNFLWAVSRGELEVSISGGVDRSPLKINRSSLADCFTSLEVQECVKVCNGTDAFEFARALYSAEGSEGIREEFLVPGLGRVRMSLLVRDGLPKRVMLVRNGLAITDSLAKFGDSLRRFPGYREFVASFEPVDADGRALLRDLENPQHNELSAERITDESRRSHAVKAMKNLVKEIRIHLRKHAEVHVEDRVALDEMAEFFADADLGAARRKGGDELDPEAPVVAKLERKIPALTPQGSASGVGTVGGGRLPTSGVPSTSSGSRSGQDPGGESGAAGAHAAKGLIPLELVRNFATRSDCRRVFFTPTESGVGVLQVAASGLSQAVEARVVGSSLGVVKADGVQLRITANQRLTIELTFGAPISGPIVLRLARETIGES